MLNAQQRREVEETLKKTLVEDVEVLLFTQKLNCPYCESTSLLMKELAELSPKIHLTEWNFLVDSEPVKEHAIERVPAIAIKGKKDYGIRFYGIPAGYEFGVFLEALTLISSAEHQQSGQASKTPTFPVPIRIKVFVTPTCPYCPQMSLTAVRWSVGSDEIFTEVIEVSEFPDLAQRYEVFGVPRTIVNESLVVEGAIPEELFRLRISEFLRAESTSG